MMQQHLLLLPPPPTSTISRVPSFFTNLWIISSCVALCAACYTHTHTHTKVISLAIMQFLTFLSRNLSPFKWFQTIFSFFLSCPAVQTSSWETCRKKNSRGTIRCAAVLPLLLLLLPFFFLLITLWEMCRPCYSLSFSFWHNGFKRNEIRINVNDVTLALREKKNKRTLQLTVASQCDPQTWKKNTVS